MSCPAKTACCHQNVAPNEEKDTENKYLQSYTFLSGKILDKSF